jgi:hypothetical protein
VLQPASKFLSPEISQSCRFTSPNRWTDRPATVEIYVEITLSLPIR